MPRPGDKAHMKRMSLVAKRSIRNNKADMSQEEVDALVEEQLKPENLPKWWYNDFEPHSVNLREAMNRISNAKKAKGQFPKPKRQR